MSAVQRAVNRATGVNRTRGSARSFARRLAARMQAADYSPTPPRVIFNR